MQPNALDADSETTSSEGNEMIGEKCEICGTVLNINGCLNCGAPVCCLKCCMDDTHPPKDNPLSGLPAGALDGGWTYAGMNRYALGLENKCAELEAKLNARAIEQEALIAEATKLSKFLSDTESKEPFEAREVTGKQEPIAWFTEDHLSDKSASTYDPIVAERWKAKGWSVTPMFATPQPCQKCADLAIINSRRGKHIDELQAKVAELKIGNLEIAEECVDLLAEMAEVKADRDTWKARAEFSFDERAKLERIKEGVIQQRDLERSAYLREFQLRIDAEDKRSKLEAELSQAKDDAAKWRDHPSAIDTKALATAQEIALMWGQDRSQFVARIQVAVTDAMLWIREGVK